MKRPTGFRTIAGVRLGGWGFSWKKQPEKTNHCIKNVVLAKPIQETET